MISNLSTFSWTSTLHVSSELTHTYGRDAHRDQASIQGDQSLCFSEAYLLQALLALSTNAWANDLTNLERVHHVGAISQTQKSLLDAWSEGRALQLEPVFGSYYLVLGKDGSALDKGWAATLPAGTQQLAVFRESQKTSLKISDGRLRFRLTKEGRLRSVSQALAGFSRSFRSSTSRPAYTKRSSVRLARCSKLAER